MHLFLLKYVISEKSRSDCMTLFGGMTPEDDAKDTGENIKLLGRWATVGLSSGYCICEALNAKELHKWLLNWSTMATIDCIPVVDDNEARKIILKSEPSYKVDYSNVNKAAKENESLFIIEYKFNPSKREEGYDMFANMTKEQDESDAGTNTCYGRWHNLGEGTGVAVCSSKSQVDLYSWAFNWKGMCDCHIQPVLIDSECRSNIQSKPDFSQKHAQLMAKLFPKRTGWFRS